MKIILASASPRRKRLLKKLVGRFYVKVARVRERIGKNEDFAKAAVRLAGAKARAVWKQGALVIGADTIAYRGRSMFRKTERKETARSILRGLRGKRHQVVTGVALVFPDGKTVKFAAKAAVRMRKWSERELEGYLKSGEWMGRAGCYDISGKGASLVHKVRGERETVIGLPLRRLKRLLPKRNGKERRKNHY